MWFNDDHLVVRRRNKQNRKKRKKTESLLTVDARVTEKRKERFQRVSAVVLTLVALVGVGWLAVAGLRFVTEQLFTRNDQYVIRQLDLLSDGKLKARHIREYGNLDEGLNLFGLNLKDVRDDLLSVPEVQSVEVSRLLPDKLVVRITERMALARLGADDQRHHLAVLIERQQHGEQGDCHHGYPADHHQLLLRSFATVETLVEILGDHRGADQQLRVGGAHDRRLRNPGTGVGIRIP